jgi:NitT/TauT family transport system substrate-binding protein
MQFNQPPTPVSDPHEKYWQQLGRDMERLRSRSRREFLAAASGVVGGTALLLGGGVALSHLGLITRNTACVNTASQVAKLSSENPETLTVCQATKSATFFPFYVAQQEGFFKVQGLKVANPPLLQVGTKVAAAVQAGRYDVGNGLITDAFGWSKTDSSARIIGAFINGYTVDIVASKQLEQEANVSPTSSLADRVNALQNKKIGITGAGSSTQGLLTYLFRQQGLDASKVTTQVSLGSSSATALAALESGAVDALSFLPPIGQLAEAKGVGDILISPMRGDIPGLKNDVHGVFYTKQSTIDSKPEAIAAYIRAIAQAESFIQDNPVQAKAHLNTYLALGPSVTDAIYAEFGPDMAKTPQIDQSSYNVAGQFHVNAGLISIIPSYSELVANNTIDGALGLSTCKV